MRARSKCAKNISLCCEHDDLDRRPVVAWNYDDQRRVDFVGGVVSGRRKESAQIKKNIVDVRKFEKPKIKSSKKKNSLEKKRKVL